jgi:indolepyruvate ferredoxin oxidoreductase
MIDYKRFAAEAFAAPTAGPRGSGASRARSASSPPARTGSTCARAEPSGHRRGRGRAAGHHDLQGRPDLPAGHEGFHDWAEGLDLIVVVEEKRKLIEIQIKEAIFDDRRGRRVYGWYKGGPGAAPRRAVPDAHGARPGDDRREAGRHPARGGRAAPTRCAPAGRLATPRADNAEEIASRLPYFCSGCPHNTSTKVPDGARAYAGIGCHYMVQWMDRETEGFTHMGGEGANWIGEAPFSTRGTSSRTSATAPTTIPACRRSARRWRRA